MEESPDVAVPLKVQGSIGNLRNLRTMMTKVVPHPHCLGTEPRPHHQREKEIAKCGSEMSMR
jgi:hypothetical protein